MREEGFAERFGDGAFVLGPADALLQRAGEADEMVKGNPALLGVIPGEIDGLGVPLVKHHHRGRRVRVHIRRPTAHREEEETHAKTQRRKEGS